MKQWTKWTLSLASISALCAVGLGGCLQGPNGDENGFEANGAMIKPGIDQFQPTQIARLRFPIGATLKYDGTKVDLSRSNKSIYQEVVDVTTESEFEQALDSNNPVLGRRIQLKNTVTITRELPIRGNVLVTTHPGEANIQLIFEKQGAIRFVQNPVSAISTASPKCSDAIFPERALKESSSLKIAVQTNGLRITGNAPAHLIFDRGYSQTLSFDVSAPSLIVGDFLNFSGDTRFYNDTRLALMYDPKNIDVKEIGPSILPAAENILLLPDMSESIVISKRTARDEGRYCTNLIAKIWYDMDYFNANTQVCERGSWPDLIKSFETCGGDQ